MTLANDKRNFGDVLVLGAGSTGAAVCRLLASLGPEQVRSVTLVGGAASEECDLTRELEGLGVACILGTEKIEGSYDLAVASPGISELSDFYAAARAHAAEVIGEPELAWRLSPERWLAITGTNGKTTTTSLAAHLLKRSGIAAEAVGNIGVPVSERVRSRDPRSWFVAELSSFQLAGARELHPRIACITNVTPDHVEWHGSLEAYAAAKERIFENLGPRDLAVISEEDDWCRAMADRASARGLRVCRVNVHAEPDSLSAAFLRDGELVVRLDGREHRLGAFAELKIVGEHNAQNALIASAAAIEAGAASAAVAAALKSFTALEHRIEPCGEIGGVRYINDSKATNTDSVEKALTAFEPGTVVLLLGGHDKGTDLASLAAAVRAGARVAVCFGEAGERIASAFEAEPSALAVVRAPHMAEAFAAAAECARPGESVLLSPACSSFDEFSSYVERGRLFKRLVAERADAAKERA